MSDRWDGFIVEEDAQGVLWMGLETLAIPQDVVALPARTTSALKGENDLDFTSALALVKPLSRFGPLFGLTQADLDRAARGVQLGVRLSPTRGFFKRVIDVIVSGSALLTLAPLILLIAVLIRRESPGPVFFRQERVGLDGSTFSMIKFRTMVVDAEAILAELMAHNEGDGVLFRLRTDPRVTGLGAFLRRFSLDELPQIWNIFVGDMSIVGPRPPLAREVEAYDDRTARRLLVKPGLTGAWQVGGRTDLSWEESVRADLNYVENWSIWGDFKIMVRTVAVVIRPVGAY